MRRGACPGLSAPMQTGDGLLVRLRPIGTISLAAFKQVCGAARQHGNGVIEITARGSIQVRGLSAASALRFADAVASLDIAAEDGIPIITNALAGLDPDELIDASALAAELRPALRRTSLPNRLAPKVSVAIDGGGALGLDTLSADVRLRAEPTNGAVALLASVGGDGASATPLGAVMASDCTEAALRLLEVIARRGRDARARDVLAAREINSFHEALSSCPALCRASTSYERQKAKDVDDPDIGERSDAVLRTAKSGHDGSAIGAHHLRDGTFACGVGLAFGHSDATALKRLAGAAELASANGVRIAPGRALLAVGLRGRSATNFTAAAERLGFIVRTDDPRRRVVACAGAPICTSALMASRAMAPRLAGIAASFDIHISGCAKGCAHPRPAAITIVGTPDGCALIANGTARDAPLAVVSPADAPAAVARYAEVGHV
jgi:precorrin-3B synthase